MPREKSLISTTIACVGLALVLACLAAGPAHGADPLPGQSTQTCPQSTPPFMVSGPASDPASTPGTAVEPLAILDGASLETTCVPPTLDYFNATPNPVDYGGSVTLSWSASSPNALSCNVSSSLGGFTSGHSGSWTAGPVTSSTYFQLYCWDAYGDGNTWGLTVGVNGGGGGGGSATPEGWLDTLTSGGVVGGWSCDPDSPGTSLYVHVYADGAFVAQVLANIYRADIAASIFCSGTGNHGYTYQLPSYLLNGAAHTIQVYAINVDASGGVVGSGNRELAGSPKTVTLNAPAPPPSISSFSAAPNGLWSGGTTVLSWNSSNAAGCSITSSPSGGSWSNLAGNGSVTTPALAAASYTYTLTCSNSAGSVSASTGAVVFSTDEQMSGGSDSGQNTDPDRNLDSSGCRWKSETNQHTVRLQVGLTAGALRTKVDWCVKKGKILKVSRTVEVDGPNFPGSLWKYFGITSYGPCDETCSNYVALYGTGRTQMNIWVQGHWGLCQTVPVVGLTICLQETFPVVGVLIKGDGTRVDTSSP